MHSSNRTSQVVRFRSLLAYANFSEGDHSHRTPCAHDCEHANENNDHGCFLACTQSYVKRGRCLCLALQAGLGKYCVHLLADYITVAAAPPLPPATSLGVSVDSSDGWQLMEPLSGLPGAALRQGALALYGACSPAEVTAAV